MPKKGYKQTKEHRGLIKKSWERPGHREMMSEKHIGQIPWNTGLTKETDERVRKISDKNKGKNHYLYGKHPSKTHRESLSKASKEVWTRPEHREKMSKLRSGENSPMYGKHPSLKTRKKSSDSHKGNHHTEESKRKIGDGSRGEKNHNYNKHLPKTTRDKIGKANKGKIWTEEQKEKIRGKNNSNYGKHFSDERRRKMRKNRLHQVFPVKDTKIEVKMQNTLREKNIIFEKHKPIMGQPDMFIQPNICIFCDGNYWHNLEKSKKRDKIVNKFLEEKGYIVLRFWEHEINNNINNCIEKVNSVIKNS